MYVPLCFGVKKKNSGDSSYLYVKEFISLAPGNDCTFSLCVPVSTQANNKKKKCSVVAGPLAGSVLTE